MTIIIVVAAICLLLVIGLLVREVVRPKAREQATPEPEVEVTRVGPRPAKSSGKLPRLDDVVVRDEIESGGGSESKPLTIYEQDAALEEASAPHDLVFLSAAAQTDAGRKRRRNEDAMFTSEEKGLFVVADGMGGYAGGDVASRIAVEAVISAFEEPEPKAVDDPTRPQRGNEVVNAIENANKAVLEAQEEEPDYAGMGTTLIAAKFACRRARVYVGHVGDSRCYRFRSGDLKLLTTDHTLAAKGVSGPMGGNLSRAVGIDAKVKVDLVVDRPRSGDRYILCSDGLSKMVAEEEMKRALATETVDTAVTQLIGAANAAGGVDNVTVVVVAVTEPT